jgi:hypothetical protein
MRGLVMAAADDQSHSKSRHYINVKL